MLRYPDLIRSVVGRTALRRRWWSHVWTLLLLLAPVPLLAAGTPAAPRVATLYSSWPNGATQYRASLDELFQKLGWPCLRVENTDLAQVMADLDRFDLFCPAAVYNYEHPQPLEQYREQWLRFLNRGGVLIGLDANYGQQIDWLTQLGEGLALAAQKCDIGEREGPQRQVTVAAPDDPFAPPADTAVPWSHFASHGPAWQVLATCPDGHAVCLKAEIGKGVLIATTLYSECRYPTADYLQRLWAVQQAKLMDRRLTATVDLGPPGPGRKMLAVRLQGEVPDGATLVRETRAPGGPWETTTVPLRPDGAATAAYHASAGRTDVRLILRAGEQALWWTSLTVENAEVPQQAAGLAARLRRCTPDLKTLAAGHPLRQSYSGLQARVAAIQAEAARLLAADASERHHTRWNQLAAVLAPLEQGITQLAGRAAVAARLARGGSATPPPFVVIRSHPLVKLHRDQAPAGSWRGSVRLTAARGEGESLQLGIVPLDRDLSDIRVRVEPLRRKGGGGSIGPDACELYRVGYVHVAGPSAGAPPTPSWWPDPLLPVDGPFAARGVCQPVWLDLFVPRSARAGRYTGGILVEAAGHRERVPVELEVLDFTLPVEHSLRQLFVFRASLVSQKYFGGDGDDYVKKVPVERILRMADVILKRRLGVHVWGNESAGHPSAVMPYLREEKTPQGWRFDFTETDRVLTHLRAAGMRTLYCGFSPVWKFAGEREQPYLEFLEAYLQAVQAHLEEKGWLEEAVYYMPDEPWQEESVVSCIRLAELAGRVAPRLKRLMTAPRDPRLQGLSQVWVPGNLPEAHPEDQEQQERLRFWQRHGAEMWWYICCGPTHPYPNFFVDYPTIDSRMVFWLTWKYQKTGFLYWGVAYHGDPKEMTPDGPTERYSVGPPHMGNGDGTLCYYGPDLTLYPSIRLNAIRDGIEDYEYLALLKRLADKAEAAGRSPALVARARRLLAVDPRVLKTTSASPNFTYTLDPQAVLAARRDLAAAILALSATP